MIIVRLWGGLGNQLFQYSFGQYLEIETDKKVFYDVASFGTSDQLRKLELCSFIPDIPLYNAYFTRYTGVKNRLFKALFQWSNTYLSESMFDICLLEKARGKIFLQGYWQEEKYATYFPMQKVLSEWETPNVLSEIEENIRSAKISVSLHVRRGDYFSPKNIDVYGVCTEKYYEQAIDRANSEIEEDKQFFVFSVIFCDLLFGNIIRQLLVYQLLLISMHDQSFPVILHQLIYIHVIRNIIRCFFIQQNLFRPATNVMLGEKNTIIF